VWIDRTAITGEAANIAQTLRPPGRLDRCRLLRPGEGEVRGDGVGSRLLHKRDEGQQAGAVRAQLESQGTARGQIILQQFSQGAHFAPPGHGRLSGRSAAKSTFA